MIAIKIPFLLVVFNAYRILLKTMWADVRGGRRSIGIVKTYCISRTGIGIVQRTAYRVRHA